MNKILVCPRDMCKVFAEPHTFINESSSCTGGRRKRRQK
jgi:hypothetical protein